jgi:hypothetical protein
MLYKTHHEDVAISKDLYHQKTSIPVLEFSALLQHCIALYCVLPIWSSSLLLPFNGHHQLVDCSAIGVHM